MNSPPVNWIFCSSWHRQTKNYARIKCISSSCSLGFYALLIQKYSAARRGSSAAVSWEKEQDKKAKQRGDKYLSDKTGNATPLRHLLLTDVFNFHLYACGLSERLCVEIWLQLGKALAADTALARPALGQEHKLINFTA